MCFRVFASLFLISISAACDAFPSEIFMPRTPVAACQTYLVRGRLAQSSDYAPGSGISVAMIGDSTIQDFQLDSIPSMLWQLWFRKRNNPFLNTNSQNGIYSFFERLALHIPTKA